MAYIKGYEYDIFMSYSHLDNLKVFHEAHGWVEEFFTNLNILLWRRIGKSDAIKFWWDNRNLDGAVLFNQSIAEGINKSALILCLTSPGYLNSGYCQEELQSFYNKAQKEPIGLNVGNRCRIINILLNNIPYAEWPRELSGTTGFPFHDAKNKDEFGDSLKVKGQPFKKELTNLREAIVKLIDEFPKDGTSDLDEPPTMDTPPRADGAPDENKIIFTIYMGDVSDSLRTVRKRIITELEKQGFKLIYDVPPPFEEEEHDNAVKEKLKAANLSVHLLDQYPGREIEGESTNWYPQKQAELSLQSDKPQLIWIPAEMNIETVEEEQYKVFLQGLEYGKQSSKKVKYIRGIKSELTQQIADYANSIQIQHLQASNGKVSVLIDTHYDDQLYALKLSEVLLKHQIQPFINPQEDDPKKNMNILGDRISQVNNLIFLYGNATQDWVEERMKAAMQVMITNNYSKKDFFVFMAPPHKKSGEISLKQQFISVNVINNSDTLQIDPNSLQQYFNSIKAVA